jgi:predicted RNase H-like HicB family nuclease
MKSYLIIIEPTSTLYSTYALDLPGCVATGHNHEEVERMMHEAVAFHLQGLREEGLPVPEPQTWAAYIKLPA